MFDALPILQQAEEVRVIAIAGSDADPATQEADGDICTALTRHKVKCGAIEHILRMPMSDDALRNRQ